MRRHNRGVFFLLALACMGLASPACAATGKIAGRVSLTDLNGQVVFGDWVRVFRVTDAIDVPGLDLAGADAAVERTVRIKSAHTAFFL